jgi:glycine/D-amino acid oxidase-like deaminating enzyme
VPVRIFDAREAAAESSWAGAGMLAPGGEIDADSPLVAPAMRSMQLWPDFIGELQNESGIQIDYRVCGGLELAPDDEKASRQSALGIRSEDATHNGLPARFYPDDAQVNPRDVTRALVTACRRRGVLFHEHEPVLAVSPDGEGVRTGQGEYRDTGVILTTGAWTSQLLPKTPRALPIRGHLISWSLTPGLLGPILRLGHTYLLQRNSGVLVAGVSTELVGFERAIDEAAAETIRQNAVRLLPELSTLAPVERWNGFRPGIEANQPFIGKIEGTAAIASYGHYRNGILLAPDTALRVADLVG